MATQVQITPHKTYATKENAVKAFEKVYSAEEVTYTVLQDEATGRWYPVAFGESAILAGVHFKFNVVSYK